MRRLLAVIASFLSMTSVNAQSPPIAKVSALTNGSLLLNGRATTLAALERELDSLKVSNGIVWYYRENAEAEPPPEAVAVIELIAARRLPMSMSSKPDFSDYIDANGQSQRRKP